MPSSQYLFGPPPFSDLHRLLHLPHRFPHWCHHCPPHRLCPLSLWRHLSFQQCSSDLHLRCLSHLSSHLPHLLHPHCLSLLLHPCSPLSSSWHCLHCPSSVSSLHPPHCLSLLLHPCFPLSSSRQCLHCLSSLSSLLHRCCFCLHQWISHQLHHHPSRCVFGPPPFSDLYQSLHLPHHFPHWCHHWSCIVSLELRLCGFFLHHCLCVHQLLSSLHFHYHFHHHWLQPSCQLTLTVVAVCGLCDRPRHTSPAQWRQ